LNPSCGAFKQASANFSFQSLDLFCEGWLGDMKPERRPSEMQLFGEHYKRFQRIDAEAHSGDVITTEI
jgi:hypothetical protein